MVRREVVQSPGHGQGVVKRTAAWSGQGRAQNVRQLTLAAVWTGKAVTVLDSCIDLPVVMGLTALAGSALAQNASEGRELAELGFAAVDRHNVGYVNHGDMEAYRDLVFVSMDADDNGKIELPEFLVWDYGFSPLAEERDRVDALETAKKVVFSFWDRNGDGGITETEHRHVIIQDFRRADLDDNMLLTEEEFLNGFSIMVAFRAALRVD